MTLIRRIKTLWILSGWDIKANKEEGSFTFDRIVRPQFVEKPIHMAEIIKRTDPVKEFLEEKK